MNNKFYLYLVLEILILGILFYLHKTSMWYAVLSIVCMYFGIQAIATKKFRVGYRGEPLEIIRGRHAVFFGYAFVFIAFLMIVIGFIAA